jgi:uncharacterized membrane protein YoaK (UPF0700 family)
MKRPALATLLSFNAGYVDTAGFLALHGLFTAHVTGNFVTLGASLVLGTSGATAKLLALPVFCAVVMSVRLLRYALLRRGLPVLRSLFLLKLLLLLIGTAGALCFGPFADGDGVPAILTGLSFVAAMAVQNALQRVHLSNAPPTTLMTGTTTQLMLDLADRWHGVPAEQQAALDARLRRMLASVAAFALGCASGALLFALVGVRCFVALPLVALLAYAHKDASTD